MAKFKYTTVSNIAVVSGTTVISRIFGFLRDVTFFSCFGVSEIGAAFLLAFSLPNMFRRLLGEGALSSALIPILSSRYVNDGKCAMFTLFSHVLVRLFCILMIVCGVVCCTIFPLRNVIQDVSWKLALGLTVAVLPYMIFVCLAAITSAALNVLGRFFVAAINQVWLNVTMIVSMLIGRYVMSYDGMELIYCLIGGVLIGGLIQILFPMLAMFVNGWKMQWCDDTDQLRQDLRNVWKLFLPGLFGAAVDQLNILVSRVIAYGFCAEAVPLLYLANRLVELPSGVFGVSILTVFFPKLSCAVANDNDRATFSKLFKRCMLAMLWILLPSAIGICVFRKEILSVLFEYGQFTSSDILRVMPILFVCCFGMVFSGMSSLFIKGFHSVRDTKTPVHVGVIILCINAVLSIVFMNVIGVVGLAIANASSVCVQMLLLNKLFNKKINKLSLATEAQHFIMIASGCFIVAIISLAVRQMLMPIIANITMHYGCLISLFVAVILSVGSYFIITKNVIKNLFFNNRI